MEETADLGLVTAVDLAVATAQPCTAFVKDRGIVGLGEELSTALGAFEFFSLRDEQDEGMWDWLVCADFAFLDWGTEGRVESCRESAREYTESGSMRR